MSSEMKQDDTGKRIVPVLACVLNQLCSRNDKIPLDPNAITKFHALRPPAISILDYLERIAKYAACSGECFVLALVYIDRIIQSNHYFLVNSLNVHRLLITSVMLAAKFFDDQYFNNAYYGKVGGVPCKEINSLEIEFLFMVNFNLFVTTKTYDQYNKELCNHAYNTGCQCQTGPAVPRPLSMRQKQRTKPQALPSRSSQHSNSRGITHHSQQVSHEPMQQSPAVVSSASRGRTSQTSHHSHASHMAPAHASYTQHSHNSSSQHPSSHQQSASGTAVSSSSQIGQQHQSYSSSSSDLASRYDPDSLKHPYEPPSSQSQNTRSFKSSVSSISSNGGHSSDMYTSSQRGGNTSFNSTSSTSSQSRHVLQNPQTSATVPPPPPQSQQQAVGTQGLSAVSSSSSSSRQIPAHHPYQAQQFGSTNPIAEPSYTTGHSRFGATHNPHYPIQAQGAGSHYPSTRPIPFPQQRQYQAFYSPS